MLDSHFSSPRFAGRAPNLQVTFRRDEGSMLHYDWPGQNVRELEKKLVAPGARHARDHHTMMYTTAPGHPPPNKPSRPPLFATGLGPRHFHNSLARDGTHDYYSGLARKANGAKALAGKNCSDKKPAAKPLLPQAEALQTFRLKAALPATPEAANGPHRTIGRSSHPIAHLARSGATGLKTRIVHAEDVLESTGCLLPKFL